MARVLLECGCPPNAPLGHGDPYGPKKGETPLITAAGANPNDWIEELGPEFRTLERRQEITRLLLASGADPNLPNAKGWTPLMLAVRQKELSLAEILTAAGADPESVPTKSKVESPAAMAAKPGMEDFLRLFRAASETKGRSRP